MFITVIFVMAVLVAGGLGYVMGREDEKYKDLGNY